MTLREMIEVMEAAERGETIEYRYRGHSNDDWLTGTPAWNWVDWDYRVAPAVPDFIDWSHVSPEYKFMARDEDGTTLLYTERPHLCGVCWLNPLHQGMTVNASLFTSYKRGTVDWKDSLVCRN